MIIVLFKIEEWIEFDKKEMRKTFFFSIKERNK